MRLLGDAATTVHTVGCLLQAMLRKYLPFAVIGGVVILFLFFRLVWFR
jgi:hypothetical protein